MPPLNEPTAVRDELGSATEDRNPSRSAWYARDWLPRFETELLTLTRRLNYRQLGPADLSEQWRASLDTLVADIETGGRVRKGSATAQLALDVLAGAEPSERTAKMRAAVQERHDHDLHRAVRRFFVTAGPILVLTSAGTMSDWLPLKVAANAALALSFGLVGYLLLRRH